MTKDLTVGRPSTVLWQFCIPMFGSIVFQQLYNIADSLIAGRFLGEYALAAVGNSYEITLVYLAFSFGCNVGCSIIVSYFYGAKEYKNLKTAISTTMITAGILSICLICFGFLGGESLLRLIRTPEDILGDSLIYLLIYTAGFPFVMFYNIATGIFSALGDSKTPFWFLACSSVSNVAVDILFVAGLNMGVAGVAWATLLCQGASCIAALLVVLRRIRSILHTGKAPVFSLKILKRIATVAVPSILQQSFISIGNIMIQGVINGFGAGVIAGYAASVKLNNLVITSFTTLGNGVSNYTAQNMGAGKPARVREGFHAGVRLVWIICIPLVGLYYFCGAYFVQFFLTTPTEAALHTGIMFLKILSPFYFVISAKLMADGVLKGAQMMNRFMVATFTDLIFRVSLAVLLSCTAMGATGIWLAWPIGWAVAAIFSVSFYHRGPWKTNCL